MNLRSVKTTKDMQLEGITIDAEWRDKQLAAVTLTDAKGHVLRFTRGDYSFLVLVNAAPEKKTVHVVSGTVRALGTEVREEFAEAYEANSRRSELEQADVLENVAVTVEEVAVEF